MWLLCAIDGAVSLLLPGTAVIQAGAPAEEKKKRKKKACACMQLDKVANLYRSCVCARVSCAQRAYLRILARFGTSQPESLTSPSPPPQRCSELSAKFQESIFRNQSVSSTLASYSPDQLDDHRLPIKTSLHINPGGFWGKCILLLRSSLSLSVSLSLSLSLS